MRIASVIFGLFFFLSLFCIGAPEQSAPTAAENQSRSAPSTIPATPASKLANHTVGIQLWPELAKLTAPDGQKDDELGYSLGASRDTVVVGAPYAKIGSHQGQGAAYVWLKPSSGWTHARPAAKLTASDGTLNSTFGLSVAISNDAVVVGADSANSGSKQYTGAAYVFVKPKTGWANMTETAKLKAGDENGNAYFGSSVSIDGNTAVVGADGARVGSNQFQGAAYVFEKPATGWKNTAQTAKLTASDGARGDQFGYSAFIGSDAAVIGARSAAVANHSRQGAAYIFVKPGAVWGNMTQTAKLTVSSGVTGDQFDASVSASNDVVVVGAPGANAAYVFVKPATGWATTSNFTVKLAPPDNGQSDQFGCAVSIKGDTILVGAQSASLAYVFVKPAQGWESAAMTARLASPESQADDSLGAAVFVSEDAMMAGAPRAYVGRNQFQGAAHIFKSPMTPTKTVHD